MVIDADRPETGRRRPGLRAIDTVLTDGGGVLGRAIPARGATGTLRSGTWRHGVEVKGTCRGLALDPALFDLARRPLSQGVPFGGGGQAHLIADQMPPTPQQDLQRFAALGLDVAITELDVRLPTPPSAADQANGVAREVDAGLSGSTSGPPRSTPAPTGSRLADTACTATAN